MTKTRLIRYILFTFVFTACLSSCASASKSLYYWGSYESQVYAYLKGESREAQLKALERDLEKIEAGGLAAPPGFYAHLGLLYTETGNDAMAVACFRAEKALFPEAEDFMDFLLQRYGI